MSAGLAASSSTTRRRRAFALMGVLIVAGLTFLVGPAQPASAQASAYPKAPTTPTGQCTTDQWQDPGNFQMCVGKLADVGSDRLQCLQAPTPEAPDSGMAGWFASEPSSATAGGPQGDYSQYGYAGYDYQMYDVGCASAVTHTSDSLEDTVANGEFMVATSVIGGSNALREKAWDPQNLWGWADTLVDKATKSIYSQVFTVFGSITLGIVGLYLLWRSRQSDMSNAMTTAGWAIFVMIAVTAIAAWPVRSAHLADQSLVAGLNAVHGAISTDDSLPQGQCPIDLPGACTDHRSPAIRASDTVTDTMLYRNWLRGLLGSADSPTAVKYGPALYDAKSLTWQEAQSIAKNPTTRATVLARKQQQWEKIAEQIKVEDPEAYSYLQGNEGMDRVGAGAIAILSSLFFALFDVTASVLVLIGFLIFRWAVIAAPILGTFGLLRPASSGLRRLANAVIAAMFNIILFGAGAAIYLYAVDLIMNTTTLPGWLQVVLVLLVGIVGWILLRPFRRITQMGGRDSAAVIAGATWRTGFLRDLRASSRLERAESEVIREQSTRERLLERSSARPETRADGVEAPSRASAAREPSTPAAPDRPRRQPASAGWIESDVPETPTNYSVYRPKSAEPQAEETTDAAPRYRRPESSPVGG